MLNALLPSSHSQALLPPAPSLCQSLQLPPDITDRLLRYGSQVAERLGNRASNQKVAGSIPERAKNDVMSLGKALHPTCLGENVPVLTVSRSG